MEDSPCFLPRPDRSQGYILYMIWFWCQRTFPMDSLLRIAEQTTMRRYFNSQSNAFKLGKLNQVISETLHYNYHRRSFIIFLICTSSRVLISRRILLRILRSYGCHGTQVLILEETLTTKLFAISFKLLWK